MAVGDKPLVLMNFNLYNFQVNEYKTKKQCFLKQIIVALLFLIQKVCFIRKRLCFYRI